MRALKSNVLIKAFACFLAAISFPVSAINLADAPWDAAVAVPGNLALPLSVEWPTATTPAYNSSFSTASVYLGYFDPYKCYKYIVNTTDETLSYFSPVSAAGTTPATCTTSAGNPQWSGNYLNWASMQVLDTFRWVLTGGYRSVDTSTQTILTKTYAGAAGLATAPNNPDKTITSNVSDVTPFGGSGGFTYLTSSVIKAGTFFYIAGNNTVAITSLSTSDTPALGGAITPGNGCVVGNKCLLEAKKLTTASVHYSGQNFSESTHKPVSAKVYRLYVNVEVCKSPALKENNCVLYSGGYKPEGLMQKYASKLRYAVFGYLNSPVLPSTSVVSPDSTTLQRDGGVLRAQMKYIGPTKPVPYSSAIANSAAEWDGTTGIMLTNPDTVDASSTLTDFGVTVTNSGAMNYLNKFGSINGGGVTPGLYKSKDPVSELYYTALRYFKKQGPVAAYTSGISGNALAVDGFPVINTWGDPIVYSCQKNFILGLGDVNTHRDANLPVSMTIPAALNGTASADAVASSNDLRTNSSHDQLNTMPVDSDMDVVKTTNMVGNMEGVATLGNKYSVGDAGGVAAAGVSTCGTTAYRLCNTYFMAGMAYDAHVRDIRSDLSGKQTINTFWMDVLEKQEYVHKNQYWMAAKYGGFSSIPDLVPYAATNGAGRLPLSSWNASGGTIDLTAEGLSLKTDAGFLASSSSSSSSGTTTYYRPDNYFLGSNPKSMKDGLTSAFSKIVSEATEVTSTGFSAANPNKTLIGGINYSASFYADNWRGSLTASKNTNTSISATGSTDLTNVDLWDAALALNARTPSSRIIVTCCTSGAGTGTATGAGLAFTATGLAGTTFSRTNYAAFSAVPGVPGSLSATDYVNYLRGDRSKEITTTSSASSSTAATTGYRPRGGVLGDIVNSKLTVIGPPIGALFESSNPGYAKFKTDYKNRKTVIYAGANDGMLHAFDATAPSAPITSYSSCTDCGKELFAYVPSFVYGAVDSGSGTATGLANLGSPTVFSHQYLVDATPQVYDIDFNRAGTSATPTTSDWRSILISGLGKGGKGFFALDVTNPADWTSESAVAGKVLWEFTDSDMGYSYGRPIIIKTKRFGWVAVLASGMNNSDGVGYFYFVNPKTGALLQKVKTPEGSSTAPLDLAYLNAYLVGAGSYLADAVYAGDLRGNVWRVDVTNDTASYPDAVKLAQLKAADGTVQPVTTMPRIRQPDGSNKRYVFVGTGRYLDSTDTSSTQKQSFYAIIDGTSAFGAFSSSSTAVQRSDLEQVTSLTAGIGASPVKTGGWFFDFFDVTAPTSTTSSSSAASSAATVTGGERLILDPEVDFGIVAFSTDTPGGDVCTPSGKSRTYVLSLLTGKSALLDASGSAIASTPYRTGGASTVGINANGGVTSSDKLGGARNDGTNTGGFSSKRVNWREVPTITSF